MNVAEPADTGRSSGEAGGQPTTRCLPLSSRRRTAGL